MLKYCNCMKPSTIMFDVDGRFQNTLTNVFNILIKFTNNFGFY